MLDGQEAHYVCFVICLLVLCIFNGGVHVQNFSSLSLTLLPSLPKIDI